MGDILQQGKERNFERKFKGMTDDSITVVLAGDVIGVSVYGWMLANRFTVSYLSAQTARDLAAHLITLADKLESSSE